MNSVQGPLGKLEATGSVPPPAAPESTERPLTVRAVFFYWLPVLVALAVFGQVAMLGLRPALAEERRLADSSEVLLERTTKAQAESEALSRLLRAQRDPVFLERERRALRVAPDAPGEQR